MAATTWKRKCICLYSDDSLHNLRLYIRCRKRRFLRRSVSWYIAVLFCSGLSYYVLLSAFFWTIPIWWLPLPILQNTILIAVNQPLADFCFVTQNQRGTKTGQNHGKIKSRTLRPKYPLWNTSVSFAKVQICPLKNEGKSLFLSFTTHFPTIVPQMWLLQTVLTSNSMTCENRVLNFVLHSDGHFQKRELAIEPNICHPYCPIFGFVIVWTIDIWRCWISSECPTNLPHCSMVK